MLPEEIVDALSVAHQEVPVDLLRAATGQRESLTEPLLTALAAWVEQTEDPRSEWNAEQGWLSDFALYLLAQWREPRAFPLYLRLCRLPEERNEYWLGDMLTGCMPAFLASTCGGDLEPLKALAVDAQAYEWSRWAAADALGMMALQGDTSSEDLARWFVQAAAMQARDPDNPFWTFAAGLQYDIAEPALMPMLRQAYADDLVDPMHVDLDALEKELRLDRPTQRQRATLYNDYPRDAGRAMSWLIEARNRPEDDESGPDNFFDDDLYYAPPAEPFVRVAPKVGRNDPCPCGSGKKYKKCCLNRAPVFDA